MKTFVFFIGGTGSRVLRSMTMLMASGVTLKGKDDSIVPIVIDFDAKNADLERADKLLSKYNTFHQSCDYFKDVFQDGKSGFFRTPLGLVDNGQYRSFSSLEKIKLDSTQSSFGGYIGYDSIAGIHKPDSTDKTDTDVTRMLLDSLYDSSSDTSRDRELNLELKHGFKGNPNIGSVVFNEYFKSEQYKQFKNAFSAGDRIFIVASIFGGTGSSGLPSLVQKFRQSFTDQLQQEGSVQSIRSAMIGACVVLPYFKVEDNSESAINSFTFNSKAKAALSYYHDVLNKDLSEVYYIGCDSQDIAYANVEGGEKQENKAHIVELLSAMSIIEFANHDACDVSDPTKYFEYTTTSADVLANPLFLDVLSRPNDKEVYQNYVKKLNTFSLFVKFFRDNTRTEENQGWLHAKPSYYKNLQDFLAPGKDFSERLFDFTKEYVAWANELRDNPILKFYPYNFDAKNLYELIKIDSSNQYKKKDLVDVITKVLNNESVKENAKDSNGGKTFLRHAYTACVSAVEQINDR